QGDGQGPAQAAPAAADQATGGAAISTDERTRLGPDAVRRIDALCIRFEAAWRQGQRPLIEDYLAEVPEPERSVLLRELVLLEIHYRRQTGEGVTLDDYRRRYPVFVSGWEDAEFAGEFWSLPTPTSEHAPFAGPEAGPPATLGQYRLDSQLARGGFGAVYLGHNVSDPLHPLAIKVLPASAHA